MSKQNMKQVGWMYHTSHDRDGAERVEYPPASQIPGIGGPPTQEELNELEQRKVTLIKETDSAYIKLAKQGGRSGLLSIKENSMTEREPKDYPRCEWFYLEDNRIEDAAHNKHQPHKVMVPDYMVHDTKPDEEQARLATDYKPRRLPYALYNYDEGSVDKTAAIPEPRPAGYGIRQEKYKNTQSRGGDVSSAGRRRQPGKDDAPHMGMLIAGGYENERQSPTQKSPRVKKDCQLKKPEPMTTTYGTDYSPQKQKPKHGRRAPPKSDKDLTDAQLKAKDAVLQKQIDKIEEDLFKMKRFKGIPAKVDSNLNPDKCVNKLNSSGREELVY